MRNKQKNTTRIIGLMSGTSHDGVDAALVEISGEGKPRVIPPPQIGKTGGGEGEGEKGEGEKGEGGRWNLTEKIDLRLVKHIHLPYRKSLRDDIRKSFNGNTELICRLNFELGEVFAKAVLSLLKAAGFRPEDISAVASHGQTIHHIPPSGKRSGSTFQIGEASVIAERTGILTISDFRTADMAAGGQGAPLVPLADYLLFKREGKVRAVLNIGGITNVTIVREKADEVIAFDTGPGNSLIDEAMRLCLKGKRSFDRNGDFARSGRPVEKLLKELLAHAYFKKRPPKSTGRETFGAAMVQDIFARGHFSAADILATLTHLTADTVYNAVIPFRPDETILTGGGVKNRFLVELIRGKFEKAGTVVSYISDYSIPLQAKEAVSFTVLGYLTLCRRPSNLPSTTGARHSVILGKISLPKQSIL